MVLLMQIPQILLAQQGSGCQSAIPLTIPFNITSVNSCSFANNYTGEKGCLPATNPNPYGGKDVFFSFVPSQSGYINIQLYAVVGDGNIRPRLYLFKGCPSSGGQCVNVLLGNTTPDGNSVFLPINKDIPYFIILDAATLQPGVADCFRFSLKSTFQPVPSVPGCTNMDFSNGNTDGWTGTIGRSTTGPTAAPTPNYVISQIAFQNDRQTIVSGGTDPCGGFPQVDPLGGPFSLRLGNNRPGAQGEQIAQTFKVTEQNSSLTYRYAVVFQDPNHPSNVQPFFRAVVRDAKGDVIPCSDFIVSAAASLPGFFDGIGPGCRSLRYKPWSTVNVDLSLYAGQEVTVEFTMGDCSAGGHYGYSYIDAFCTPSTLNALGDTICIGESVTMRAPDGYSSYRWLPMGSTSQSVTVKPDVSTTYTLELTAFNGCKSNFQIPIVVTNFPLVSFNYDPDNCDTPVRFTETGVVNVGGLQSKWVFGASATPATAEGSEVSALFPGEGTYPVKLIQTTAGGCVDSVTQNVDVPKCFFQVRLEGDTVCPGECYTIPSTIHFGTAPYNYRWSDGSTNATLSVCPAQTTTYYLDVTDASGLTDADTVKILVSPPADFDPLIKNISCTGLTDGSIDPRPSGFDPFVFKWDNNSSENRREGLLAGNYSLEVTDRFGCTSAETFQIIEPGLINADISLVEPTCNTNTGSIIINAVTGGTPGFRYGSGNGIVDVFPRFDKMAEGDYTILVIDTNGCENRFPVSLRNTTAPQSIDFTVVKAVCNTPTGEITINGVNGGRSPFSYALSATATPQPVNTFPFNITALEGISYTLRIKDANDCYLDTLISLAQPGAPESLIAQATPTSCGEANGSVSLFLTGGVKPVQFSIDGINFQPDSVFTGVKGGIYQAMIRDVNNCTLIKTVEVDTSAGVKASINVVAPVKCFNDSNAVLEAKVSGGVAPYSIEWSDSTEQEALKDVPAGFYRIIVTDADGCGARDSITLINPRPIIVQITGKDSLCAGDSLKLFSNVGGEQGAVQYNWENGLSAGASLAWVPDASGLAELIVTDALGCTDTTEKQVTVLPIPAGAITVDKPEACEPHCVIYGFNPATTAPIKTFQWSSPESPGSLNNTLSVCYPLRGYYGATLVLTDIFGCIDTLSNDSLVKVNPLPVADFSLLPEKTDILRPLIKTNQRSKGADFFFWNFGDGDTSQLEEPSHAYRDTGIFKVCLTVETIFNCLDDTCNYVEIEPFPTFYAPNTFTPDGSGVNDTFKLYFTYETEFRLDIFNRWGELIFFSEDGAVGWDGTYSGQKAQSDVYVWRATFRNVFKEDYIKYGRVLLLR